MGQFGTFGSECCVLLFAIENIRIKVYKSVVIIQPVVSSKYKICFLTFGSEQRCRLLQKYDIWD
jgi:hypothetical protein